MGSIISRRLTEKDKSKLNALYNSLFKQSRTIENFDWEFINNPQGEAYSWILEDAESSDIIGHYGLIPLGCGYWGKSILAGKTENAMLHPQYRGKGLYVPFEVDCIRRASEKFQLIWTSYSSVSGIRTHMKAGYIPVGKLVTYTHVNKMGIANMLSNLIKDKISSRIVRYFLQELSGCISRVFVFVFSKNIANHKEIRLEKVKDINTVAKELTELWDNVKADYGITVARSIPYLRWKIFNNPYIKYDFYVALKQQRLVGYVITRVVKKDETKRGVIVDIIVAEPKTKMLDCVLAETITNFLQKGICHIEFPTLKSNNFINKALKRSGFVSLDSIYAKLRRREANFLAIPLDNTLNPKTVFNPNNWYFTHIFTEY